MGHSLPDIRLTEEWVDITTISGYAEIATKKTTIQAKFVSQALVYVGGLTAPEEDDGQLLLTAMAITQTNANWWVKGQGKISILIEE